MAKSPPFQFCYPLLLTSVALLKTTGMAQAANSTALPLRESFDLADQSEAESIQAATQRQLLAPPTSIAEPEIGSTVDPALPERADGKLPLCPEEPEASKQQAHCSGMPMNVAPDAPVAEIPQREPLKLAQITPDSTLGNEGSVVVPTVIQGIPGDRIEGGAIRGANLFHSFTQFNVGENRAAYFSNPAGVQNILSRVTGADPSIILGRLGVLGQANLYLINPNGIIFGPNASLDVKGSFIGTTASSIPLGTSGVFSATDPGSSTLLAVEPSALFLNSLSASSGNIMVEAELSVGKSLQLMGRNVTSTGSLIAPAGLVRVLSAENTTVKTVAAQSAQLLAGNNLILQESKLQTTGDLILIADNTVRIRDSVQTPFLAQAGGQLYIQGSQAIDILALNHPGTPFQSAGNLTLVSDGNVSGDAHYYTGGSFAILNRAGLPGTFVSLYDPIISANGNVEFGSYTGPSLKVEAVGNIKVTGSITINAKDTSFGDDGIVQSIANVELISTAGILNYATAKTTSSSMSAADLENYLEAPGESLDGKLTALGNGTPKTGSAIKVKFSLDHAETDTLGNVVPTTKDVTFNWNFTTFESTTGPFNDFAFYTVSAAQTAPGAQTFDSIYGVGPTNAQNQAVTLAKASTGAASGIQTIRLKNSDTAQSTNFVLGIGAINVQDNFGLSSVKASFPGINLSVSSDPDVSLLANSAALILRAGVSTLSNPTPDPPKIQVVDPGGTGTWPSPVPSPLPAGTVVTTFSGQSASSGTLTLKGNLNTATGGGGPVILTAKSDIKLIDTSITTGTSGASGTPQTGSVTLRSETGNIFLTNSSIQTSIQDGLNAGDVEIIANTGRVSLIDSYINSRAFNAVGGQVTLRAGSNSISNTAPAIALYGSTIDPAPLPSTNPAVIASGVSGATRIEAENGLIQICNTSACDASGLPSTIYADTFSQDNRTNSGGISIAGKQVRISNYSLNAELRNDTQGNGGGISITGNNWVEILNKTNILTSVGSAAQGQAGPITIRGGAITIADSNLNASVLNGGVGKGGDIQFENFSSVVLQDQSLVSTAVGETGQGAGGKISFSSSLANSSLTIQDDSTLNATTASSISPSATNPNPGAGGNVVVNVKGDVTLVTGASIQTAVKQASATAATPVAAGGNIIITAANLALDEASLDASTSGQGPGIGGSIQVFLDGVLSLTNQSKITTSTAGQTDSGSVQIIAGQSGTLTNTQTAITVDRSKISAAVEVPYATRSVGTGNGGKVEIIARSGSILLTNSTAPTGFDTSSLISASTSGPGQGGDVKVEAQHGGSIFVKNGARIETRTSGAGNFTRYSGAAGDLQVNAANIEVSGSTVIQGLRLFSGLLASTDTAKSGQASGTLRRGSITINEITPGRSLVISEGAFLSVLNRSDFAGGSIRINVNDLQLLTGGQIIAAAEGLGDAGSIHVNAQNVTIAGQNPYLLDAPLLQQSGSGFLPEIEGANNALSVAGAQPISSGVFRLIPTQRKNEIDFSTLIPYVTVAGAGDGSYDYYLISANAGDRAIFDIDSSGSTTSFDSQITLYDANHAAITASDILAANDDSFLEGPLRGSSSSRNSYIDYTFKTSGNFIIAVTQWNGTAEGAPIAAGTSYQLQVSIDPRNTFNPNLVNSTRVSNSGFFASSATSTGGDITLGSTAPLRSLQVTDGGKITASTLTGTAGSLTVNAASVQIANQGSLTSEATRGGSAGSLQVNTGNLFLNNGSIAVSSTGLGTAGNLLINAPQITLENQSSLKAETEAGDSASGITLKGVNQLTVTNSSISAQTVSGEAGSLTLNQGGAPAAGVFLNDGNLSLAAIGNGKAGDILLNTVTLSLFNNSTISTESNSVLPTGRAGSITSNAINLLLSNSKISASTVRGQGGIISLMNLNTLNLANSEISTSTKNGQSGTLLIYAGQSINLTGPGGLLAKATGVTGTAGNIQVFTDRLDVVDGAEISTSTAGAGAAGNIQVFASNRLNLSGGTINSRSTSTGNAGSIALQTRVFRVDTGGQVLAESQRGGGGQISLSAREIWLRGSSPVISSVFDGSGNGGNITIDSFIFVALEDSDILANAEFGDGGRIIISAPAFIADIFAPVRRNLTSIIQFRGNGRVDISASSRFGVSGVVRVPDFSALAGSLTDLSNNFVNSDQIVANSCIARRNAQGGSFTVTGTGGLASTPYDAMTGTYNLTDVQSIGNSSNQSPNQPLPPQSIAPPEQMPAGPIQEAQGMMTTTDGRIVLGRASEFSQVSTADRLVCQ